MQYLSPVCVGLALGGMLTMGRVNAQTGNLPPLENIPTVLRIGSSKITLKAYLWEDRMPCPVDQNCLGCPGYRPCKHGLQGVVDIETEGRPVPFAIANFWVIQQREGVNQVGQTKACLHTDRRLPAGAMSFRLGEIEFTPAPSPPQGNLATVVTALVLANGRTVYLRSPSQPIEITY
ncbi:MAG: hypothetical protein ACK421_07575 [Pseudanabaenaceae cyanobacterium]